MFNLEHIIFDYFKNYKILIISNDLNIEISFLLELLNSISFKYIYIPDCDRIEFYMLIYQISKNYKIYRRKNNYYFLHYI